MLNSIVRDALLASVTCTLPPVRFQTSHESTVPNASSPAFALARAPGTFCRIHCTFVRGEIGVDHEPGLAADHAIELPRSQAIADRRGAAVLPDDGVADRLARSLRSHTTVVSRWLVMPMAAMSAAPTFAFVQRLGRDARLRGPDLARVVLDPAGLRERSAETPSARRRRWSRRDRRRSRASWSCPGRERGCIS